MKHVLACLPLAWAGWVMVGCGGGHGEAARSPADAPRTVETTAPVAPAPPPIDTLPGLAQLAARGQELAPGMNLLAQGEAASPGSIDLPAAAGDECVRALFVATSPVKAVLQLKLAPPAEWGRLAETAAGVLTGVLGGRGPVCIRRGQNLALRFERTTPRVRYVVWATTP